MAKQLSSIKCAIVHDSILEYGGAERVLQTLFKLFPNTELYTLAANKTLFSNFFPDFKLEKLNVLISNRFYRSGSLLQFIAPFVFKKLNFENFDLVISSTSYLMSSTVRVYKAKQILYVNNIPKNLFNLSPKNTLQNIFDYSFLVKNIFIKSLKSTNNIISNSKYTRNILLSKFGIDSIVIYPPVHITSVQPKKSIKKYFLSVSRLNKIKNIDLIIRAFNKLKLPLKIIGSGSNPEYINYLKSISGRTIEFLGFKKDQDLKNIYRNAYALVCASTGEEFGISAVEAQGYGVPVIAFFGGGYKETIIPFKTGVFYYKNSSDSLVSAIRKYLTIKFDPITIHTHALKFREERFLSDMKKYIYRAIS